MSDTDHTSDPKALPPPQPRQRLSRSAIATGTVAALLIAGAALGAGGTRLAQNWQPRSVMLLQPAPIDKMQERSPVAIKGDVAEIFGNKFVVQDSSGRALVDTGPRGEDRMVVAKGETVTVQGRFDRGVVRPDGWPGRPRRSRSAAPERPRRSLMTTRRRHPRDDRALQIPATALSSPTSRRRASSNIRSASATPSICQAR